MIDDKKGLIGTLQLSSLVPFAVSVFFWFKTFTDVSNESLGDF